MYKTEIVTKVALAISIAVFSNAANAACTIVYHKVDMANIDAHERHIANDAYIKDCPEDVNYAVFREMNFKCCTKDFWYCDWQKLMKKYATDKTTHETIISALNIIYKNDTDDGKTIKPTIEKMEKAECLKY